MADIQLIIQNYSNIDIMPLDLLIDKQPSHALSSTNAHAGDQDLLLRPTSLAQDSSDLACASCAERVTDGDSTATRVDLGVLKAEVLDTVHGHGGKGLVDLVDVNVVLVELELAQQLGDSSRGADAHHARRDTGDGGTAEFGQDGLVQLDGLGAAHQEDGGSW